MSVDQKQNLVLKNVEEERAQFEAMKDQVVEEKEEDGKKSEEESEESEDESSLSDASSSDLETGNVLHFECGYKFPVDSKGWQLTAVVKM